MDTTTDPNHCGACGHTCGGGSCEASTCLPVVLASGQLEPTSIAVDSDGVYWTSWAVGSVTTAPKTGGMPLVLATDDAERPAAAIVTDSVNAYWISSAEIPDKPDPGHGGKIMVVPKKGGTATLLADDADGIYGVVALAGDDVYYTHNDYSPSSPKTWVARVPKSGGTPVAIKQQSGSTSALAVDATHVYWATWQNDSGGITGRIHRKPLAGGGIQTLVTSDAQATSLAVDDSNLYWIDGLSAVMTMPKNGGAPVEISSGKVARLVIDDTSVYWVDRAEHVIMRMPKAGGAPSVVSRNSPPVQHFAVDEAWIYWTAYNPGAFGEPPAPDGVIMKLVK